MNLLLNPVDKSINRLLTRNTDFLAFGTKRTRFVKIILDHSENRKINFHLLKNLIDSTNMCPTSVQKDKVGIFTH